MYFHIRRMSGEGEDIFLKGNEHFSSIITYLVYLPVSYVFIAPSSYYSSYLILRRRGIEIIQRNLVLRAVYQLNFTFTTIQIIVISTKRTW